MIAEGQIDGASSLQAISDVVSDPDFVPTDRIIVDLRNIEYLPQTPDLFLIADRIIALKSKLQGEITVVVNDDIFYLARLACVITSSAGIKMNAVTVYEEEN